MFRNIIFTVLCLPLFLLSNCKSTGNTTSENPTTEGIPFTTLLSDSQSNIQQPTKKVITAQQELDAIFAKVNSTRMPGIPVPEVDFSTYEVFLYSPGEVNHGTQGIQVATVAKTNNKIEVTLAANKSQGDYVTTVMSQPCVMIKYKKQGLPVVVKTAAEN
ncbi:hypothetical protein [Marinirhabdus gelatinilytica]|uniref:Protease stability complex PrcB-like protein n=1 Tax=Marinirhabdus gelatinilytica TaxID=1703343 RepID=A0A370Q567_9FLAO|nr:hypothetical protein [Marinirhabdus gelatinilytica]RDK83517.1 hypothetical protein C8D94_10754 [Marinirhabdus gelatinilytica]